MKIVSVKCRFSKDGVFVIAHIPIYAVLVALVASTNERIRDGARIAIAAFLVVHGGLHALFMNHPDYEFSSVLSNALIFGGAALGAMFLMLRLWPGQANKAGKSI